MGKWISILMQIYIWQRSLSKSNEIIDFAQRKLAYIKGFALAGIGFLASAFFFVTGLVTAIIQVGLQMERDGHVSFSGLMISSVIFFGIALFLALASFIPLVLANKEIPAKPEPQPFQVESLFPILEEFLRQVVQNLSKPEEKAKKKSKASDESDSD